MHELIRSEYSKVTPLLRGISYDTVYAHAVIEGRQKGRVFADSIDDPTAVFIWHYCGMSMLAGDAVNDAFIEEVSNLLLNNKNKEFGHLRIVACSGEWDAILTEILGDKLICYTDIDYSAACVDNDYVAIIRQVASQKVIQYSRAVFKFKRDRFEQRRWECAVPGGFELKPIDGELFQRLEGSVVPRHYWETSEDFAKGGFGFCLLEGDKIACTAFSAYVGDGKIDIGIETMQEYRNRGLGVVTAAAMIAECVQRGNHPVWGCRRDNEGSFKLAGKLGFELQLVHPIYFAIK